MRKFILDLLFPVTCLGCGQEGEFLCSACRQKIPLSQKPPRENLLVAADYRNPLVRESIHQFKYNFIKDLARPLGRIMSARLRAVLTISENTLLIPVPLHPKRLRWRGFNQAELLSQEISRRLNVPVVNNLLIRKKHTLPQVKIANAKERKQNINQAFELALSPSLLSFPRKRESRNKLIWIPNQVGNDKNSIEARPQISGKTLILIDDIATTGATLKQCAQTLKPLKPKQIWKLVLAKG